MESPDAVTWTNDGAVGNAIVSNCFEPSVVRIGGTYHLFCTAGAFARFDHYTSTNKITWTLSASGIITTSINALAQTGVANMSVLYNPDGSGNWYALFGCNGFNATFTGHLFRTCGVTTTDINGNSNWTFASASPFTGVSDAGVFNGTQGGAQGFGNPDLHYIPSAACPWWEWDGSFGIMRFASCNFNDLWLFSQIHPSLPAAAPTETNQLSDPSLIEVNGKTYMFYDGYSTNSTSFGVIKLAIANMPLAILTTTNEGAQSDWP